MHIIYKRERLMFEMLPLPLRKGPAYIKIETNHHDLDMHSVLNDAVVWELLSPAVDRTV